MNRSSYILVLCCWLLQSCDFFYSTVEYKGTEAKPRLCVVASNTANSDAYVHVLHSEYFLHTDSMNWPAVENALVTFQVNNMPPVVATEIDRSLSGSAQQQKHEGTYTAPLVFNSNDTVRLHVEHPNYGSADAVQICPMKQTYMLSMDSLVNNTQLWLQLHLPAYHGAATDVIELYFEVEGLTDTATIDYNALLYSLDESFDVLNNYQTNYDYYAGTRMYLPVSDSERVIPIVLASPYGWFAETDSVLQDVSSISVRGYITVRTIDGYKYIASLRRINDRSDYIYIRDFLAPEKDSYERMDFSELLENISTEFEVLGNAESYQVNGNMTPANPKDLPPFGCFYLYQEYRKSNLFPTHHNL